MLCRFSAGAVPVLCRFRGGAVLVLDINILVRSGTGAPAEQASRSTIFRREADHLEPSALIVADLVDVLDSVSERTRPEVAALVRSVLAPPPGHAPGEVVLVRAVESYETGSVRFVEATTAGLAEQREGTVASLDRDGDRIDSFARIEP